ncbi:SET domain-containing protein [Nodosilinea sp. E11]|uniref:SET domain-containing protein n=1 Tax=Nodosilinea sp. E11 TaxID=3037479 RepID=UPI002934B60C|nr:SET domain-containing protein [Nodosilinea sp. E11]WOD37062.1 SET domain-containing protein [Nodosilinea sp. E11]
MTNQPNYPQQTGDLSFSDIDHLIDNAPNCGPGTSQIHGYGLIAVTTIEKGNVIIDFSDRKLYVEKRFSELEQWRLKSGKYTGISEEKCVISEKFTKYSLLNHSRQPNAITDFEARKVIALRDILPGEEVTVDYRLEPVSSQAKSYIQHFI